MPSSTNRHCANCIGTLLFPIGTVCLELCKTAELIDSRCSLEC